MTITPGWYLLGITSVWIGRDKHGAYFTYEDEGRGKRIRLELDPTGDQGTYYLWGIRYCEALAVYPTKPAGAP